MLGRGTLRRKRVRCFERSLIIYPPFLCLCSLLNSTSHQVICQQRSPARPPPLSEYNLIWYVCIPAIVLRSDKDPCFQGGFGCAASNERS